MTTLRLVYVVAFLTGVDFVLLEWGVNPWVTWLIWAIIMGIVTSKRMRQL